MHRAARTARGTFGALAITLLAAASHALAGGDISWLSVAVGTLVALPLCVALAGRTGSLWRLGIAVGAAQFLYHWSFVGLGVGSSAGTVAHTPQALHAQHLGALSPVVPGAGASGSLSSGSGTAVLGNQLADYVATADAAMWLGHAVAAVLTVALLHSGERACLAIVCTVRGALPLVVPLIVALPERSAIRPRDTGTRLRTRLDLCSTISHRGPPALLGAL